MLNKTGVVMVDINHSPELASDFHVYGTPTLMVVKHGVIEKVKLGKLSEKKINQFFDD
jgi:thioredoxin-like negative regulator of GroEL